MAKTFKRIAALATAIALVVCFAVSASAIQVTTTTQYAATEANVNVTVNVSDAPENAAYVTYYATKGSTPVFIDQEELDNGQAEIKYQTAATNLNGNVKVGYTGAPAAEDKFIDGWTVTATGYTVTPSVVPNKVGTEATVTIAYTPTPGNVYDSIVVTGAEGDAQLGDGAIVVSLSNITGNVTIEVKEKAETTSNVNVLYVDGAAITVTAENLGETDDNKADKAGDRKLTAIGQVTGAEKDTDYGIIISTAEIEDGTLTELPEGARAYQALGSNDKGVFAVQVIDTGVDSDALIVTGQTYYVAIYALVDGAYKVDVSTITVQ